MQKFFNGVCWLISAYFLLLANYIYGFPPDLTGRAGVALIASFVLFILPFAKRLSLSGVFDFEAKVEKVKGEVEEFKKETRDLLKIQNSLISSVSANQTTQNIFHIPSLTDAANAERQIPQTTSISGEVDDRIARALGIGNGEINVELARTRMELERTLRDKVGKSISLGGRRDVKYLSLSALWRKFLENRPEHRNLDAAMRYVTDICNAAVHGQMVPQDNAIEAIKLGEEIRMVLS
ncbi:hypothetical protein [Breoghania sp.]|uniref:hypothetical protein n=1 Tax=Breoghania sp. TaxID=2065378 RepID=UPI002AAAA33B|nr:hypothetical protein [Breoghania sp.]